MGEVKLFRLSAGKAGEIRGVASGLEKPLQTLIEANLEPLLGVRLVASEYSTGSTHAGRIDTLGIDENDSPVILEYKRSVGESVINQGLFYLDWLMDHRAEFKLLVLDLYGKATADRIDWSSPRLVCIAADFTRYDSHAVRQMSHSIELIRYRHFDSDLLLLELVNVTGPKPGLAGARARPSTGMDGARAQSTEPRRPKGSGRDKTVAEVFGDLPTRVRDLFQSLESYTLSLGDDVLRKDLRLYIAFRRIKNFVTVVPQRDRLTAYARLDPDRVGVIKGFSRDVTKIGHWGTGDLEFLIRNEADLELARPLIRLAYEGEGRSR